MLVLVALSALVVKCVALPIWEDYTLSPLAKADRAVRAQLERPLVLDYPAGTSLELVIKDLRGQTACAWLPDGIPFYIEPIGLQEAERTMSSEVTIDLDDIPLEVTLRLCFRQLGMVYVIKDGLLWITSEDSELSLTEDFANPDGYSYWKGPLHGSSTGPEDPYLVVGHCLLALLGAGIGAVAGPMAAWASTRSNASSQRA